MPNQPPVLVIGGELNGLSVCRSLAQGGIKTYVLDTKRHKPAMWSRSAIPIKTTILRGAGLLTTLRTIGLPEPTVLIITDEMALLTISEHRAELGRPELPVSWRERRWRLLSYRRRCRLSDQRKNPLRQVCAELSRMIRVRRFLRQNRPHDGHHLKLAPLRWRENPSWKLDYSNIERLSPEEMRLRRQDFDRQKEIAKNIRDRSA